MGEQRQAGAHEAHLRRAHAVLAEAHVHRRGERAVEDLGAALDELDVGDRGEHLGVVLHQRAGQRDRRGGAGDDAADDDRRQPRPRPDAADVAELLREPQRADDGAAAADERRSRSASSPPATTRAISTAASASCLLIIGRCTCLVVLLNIASRP